VRSVSCAGRRQLLLAGLEVQLIAARPVAFRKPRCAARYILQVQAFIAAIIGCVASVEAQIASVRDFLAGQTEAAKQAENG